MEILRYILDSYNKVADYKKGNAFIQVIGILGVIVTFAVVIIAFVGFEVDWIGLRVLLVSVLFSLLPVFWNMAREK